MQSSINKTDRFIVFMIVLCQFFLTFISLKSSFVFRLEREILSTTQYYVWLIVSFFLIIVFDLYHRSKRINIALWLFGVYLVLVYLTSVHFKISDIVSALALIFFGVCFSFGDRLSNSKTELRLFYINTVNLIIVLPLVLYSIFMFFTTNMLTNQNSTDAFFHVIVYLPFVMLLEKKTLKTILYLLMVVSAAISMKRSLIIGVAASTLIYLLLSKQNRVFFKWYFWFSLLAVVALTYYLFDIISDTLFYRFAQLEEDGGTGRDVIYNTILSSFQQSDIISKLLGHGYRATTAIVGKLAHNDLLQLLYDCGVVGLGLYLAFLIPLIALAVRKHRNCKDKNYYAAFVGTIVLYLVLSFFNCFIYTTLFLSPIMLALGIMSRMIRDS